MAPNQAARIPRLLYGTAWKKNQTQALVYQALEAGFRGVDTAAQPKHYQEDLVGEGIREAIRNGIVKREDLYVRVLTKLLGRSSARLTVNATDPNKIHINPWPGSKSNAL